MVSIGNAKQHKVKTVTANATRPDIAYAVNRLASYTANLSLQYITALKQILHYLLETRTYDIIYYKVPKYFNFFYGFANAAYVNTDDYKSTSGYVFIAKGNAIIWRSKKQATIALSSIEVEYVALSKATCKAFWLRNLYAKLKFNQKKPTLIRGDNNRSIAIMQNS